MNLAWSKFVQLPIYSKMVACALRGLTDNLDNCIVFIELPVAMVMVMVVAASTMVSRSFDTVSVSLI